MSVGQRVGATTIRAAKILEESLTEEGADETRTFENLPLGGAREVGDDKVATH